MPVTHQILADANAVRPRLWPAKFSTVLSCRSRQHSIRNWCYARCRHITTRQRPTAQPAPARPMRASRGTFPHCYDGEPTSASAQERGCPCKTRTSIWHWSFALLTNDILKRVVPCQTPQGERFSTLTEIAWP